MNTALFKNKYRIKSTRLKNWDYSYNGVYSVTICTKNRELYFGNIKNGKIKLLSIGKFAQNCWQDIPRHYPFVILDDFIIMPNHIHGIIAINHKNNHNVETQNFASLHHNNYKNKFGPQSKNLSSIIRGFKIGVKKWATLNNKRFQWQPRFYDHIIRNDESLNEIRKYIRNNPLRWGFDRNNPEQTKRGDKYA